MAGRTARHQIHCTTLFMNIRWKWVSYFHSHSELATVFGSPHFSHIFSFLQFCLQMNRLHWSHFIDADECFCRPHMKQLPRFFSGLPAMPSPSSSTGSGRYFFKKCGDISRQWRYLRSWEEMLSLESTMDFSRKIFCFAVHRMVCWWCIHPRIDARNFHKDIKHSKWPGPCDTRDEIRCTHLVTCPRHPLSYYSPG